MSSDTSHRVQDLIDPIVQSPWFGVAGMVVAIISVLLTCVFYVRSRRFKRLSWAVRSNTLIRGSSATLPRLSVLYADEEVENLTVSKVALWNSGTETTVSTDIAEVDPLRIEARDDVVILDASVLQSNNAAAVVAVVREPGLTGHTKIHFDYLDRGNGAVIQVIHRGLSSQDLGVRGTLKGARKLLDASDADNDIGAMDPLTAFLARRSKGVDAKGAGRSGRRYRSHCRLRGPSLLADIALPSHRILREPPCRSGGFSVLRRFRLRLARLHPPPAPRSRDVR